MKTRPQNLDPQKLPPEFSAPVLWSEISASRVRGPAMIPSRLGRCEILEELGTGAMGRVYRGEGSPRRREVAIKVLSLEEFPRHQRNEILGRFRREAQAAGRLAHPNIVTIDDVGESFFVMELVRGDTLQSCLASNQRLDPEKAASLAAPIASALD